MSMALPQPFASLEISQGEDKKKNGKDNHQEIEHRKTPLPDCRAGEWKIEMCGGLREIALLANG
jgi:hypothetical protein